LRVWRYARPVVSLGLLALAVVVLLGRKGELSGTAASFSHIDAGWVVLGVTAEALSMMSFALVSGRLLGEAGFPLKARSLMAIALGGNALTNSLPAGAAFGAAYAFRRYQERSVPDIVSGWVVMAVTVLAAAALAVLASVGVMAALGQGTALDLVGVTAATLAVAALLLAVVREPQVVAPLVSGAIRLSRALFRRPRVDGNEVAYRLRERLCVVTPSWPGLWIALGWALANWLLDLACLVCAFGAVDSPVPWRGLLLAYGAAQLAANLPITPGGLGVVEGSLTIGLVAYGGAEASSVAAVLVYRVISFWALLVVGWACIGGLAVLSRRRRAEAAAELEEVPA
jgi:putative heme transporter